MLGAKKMCYYYIFPLQVIAYLISYKAYKNLLSPTKSYDFVASFAREKTQNMKCTIWS